MALHDFHDHVRRVTSWAGLTPASYASGTLVFNEVTKELRSSDGTYWYDHSLDSLQQDGFLDITQRTMSFNDGNRRLTIQPTVPGGSFSVKVQGRIFIKLAAETCDLPNPAQGVWYFYYDTTGTLQRSQSVPSWGSTARVAVVYWDETATSSYLSLTDDSHGAVMSWATHKSLHENIGCKWQLGLDLSWTSGDGTNDLHAEVGLGDGEIGDEDLDIAIAHQNPIVDPFRMILTLPAQIPIWYKFGLAGNNRWMRAFASAPQFPFLYNAALVNPNASVDFNENNAGTWRQTEVTATYYVNYYLCATPRYAAPLFMVQGQKQHSTLVSALGETLASLSLVGFPSPEFVQLYRVTLQGNTAAIFTNTPHTRIVAVTRMDQAAPSGVIPVYTPHAALVGKDLAPSHAYYGLRAIPRVVSAVGPTAWGATDDHIILNAAANNVDITLPDVATNVGRRIQASCLSNAGGAARINRAGADTIHDAIAGIVNTYTFAAAWVSLTLEAVYDGTNYYWLVI